MLLRTTVALATLATAAFALSVSSIWNDDGDLVMSPEANRSVFSHSDIFVNGEKVFTLSEVDALLAPLAMRLSVLEAELFGVCASSPCQNGATCSPDGMNYF